MISPLKSLLLPNSQGVNWNWKISTKPATAETKKINRLASHFEQQLHYLEMDIFILNRGRMSRTTHEQDIPLATSIPHQREDDNSRFTHLIFCCSWLVGHLSGIGSAARSTLIAVRWSTHTLWCRGSN
ncbi:hypothetical protein AVEN_121600-1 [Araneus ventricosus]|uniref:Uncharacterized protein n=1 Tax=Araneus ventricosus TaxID=182803 RepID=A0A4Y2LVK3_ARAVE|nr:hypothetical protein AVEN_121600-1 [Araneus ventricosus]